MCRQNDQNGGIRGGAVATKITKMVLVAFAVAVVAKKTIMMACMGVVTAKMTILGAFYVEPCLFVPFRAGWTPCYEVPVVAAKMTIMVAFTWGLAHSLFSVLGGHHVTGVPVVAAKMTKMVGCTGAVADRTTIIVAFTWSFAWPFLSVLGGHHVTGGQNDQNGGMCGGIWRQNDQNGCIHVEPFLSVIFRAEWAPCQAFAAQMTKMVAYTWSLSYTPLSVLGGHHVTRKPADLLPCVFS